MVRLPGSGVLKTMAADSVIMENAHTIAAMSPLSIADRGELP